MIEWIQSGDILSDPSDAIVIPTNTTGAMGAGLALAAKQRWPTIAAAYLKAPAQIGDLCCYQRPDDLQRLIVCLPTKRHWRDGSRLDDVGVGLNMLATWLIVHHEPSRVRSIAIPPLGCGLGGLAYADVRPLIEAFAARVPEVQVVIYEPL